MLFSRLVAILFVITSIVGASAGFAADYALGAGDKLRISVYQWDILNNVYTVDPGGQISLPIIGAVPAAGKTAGEVGNAISNLLATQMKLAERPTTSVEIAQFRPFYVLGDVSKPGDYPYRPGMIVLDALAIAGGYYRPGDVQSFQLKRDDIIDRGKLSDDVAKLDRLYVQRARLQAALKGQAALPDPIPNSSSNHDAVLAQEAAILSSQQADLRDRVAALEQAEDLLRQEIVRRQSQLAAVKDELQGLQNEEADVRSLKSKGLTTTSRETTLAVTIADVKRTQFDIETNIVRAQQDIADDLEKEKTIKFDFNNKSALELSDVETKIGALESEINALRQTVDGDPQTTSIKIVRRKSEGLTKLQAQELDPVEPGDIITFETHAAPPAEGVAGRNN